jgi:hypothetical protein
LPRSASSPRLVPALVVSLALLALLPAGAGAQSAPGSPALVRVVHFAFGAPPVDVSVDGQPVAPGLGFKDASRYVSLPAGSHTITATKAGGGDVAGTTVDLAAGKPYTVALLGKPGQYRAVLVRDDFTPPPPGMARLRLLNANPDSPGVDVTTPGGAQVLVRDVRYGEASPYAAVPAGRRFASEIRVAGTSRVLLSFEGAEPLLPRAVITVVGARTESGVEFINILDAAGARTAPRGGVATGAGGTAGEPGPAPGLMVAAVAALAVAAATRRRRVPR